MNTSFAPTKSQHMKINSGYADVLVGLQFGDEGKGKVIDTIAGNYHTMVRFQGGPNSGHTVYDCDGEKVVFNVIPSGMLSSGLNGLLTNGVVINPFDFISELNRLMGNKYLKDLPDRMLIDNRVNITVPTHILIDHATELYRSRGGSKIIGSTKRGNTPTYSDLVARRGITIQDMRSTKFERLYIKMREEHINYMKGVYGLTEDEMFSIEISKGMTLHEYESEWYKCCNEMLRLSYVENAAVLINDILLSGNDILIEAAQGAMLDLTHGTYPYVTSSNVTAPSALASCGVSPNSCARVFGVMKPYITRVGNGFFPTHISDDNIAIETANEIISRGGEYGSVTGRKRMIGWLDLPQLRYACMINGITDIVLTKVDVVEGLDMLVCDSYVSHGTKYSMYRSSDESIVAKYSNMPVITDAQDMDNVASLIAIIDDAVSCTVDMPVVSMVSVSKDSKIMEI